MVDKYDYEKVNLLLWARSFIHAAFIDTMSETVC